jgi:glycerol-3-phosphate acyltransferase PlsY
MIVVYSVSAFLVGYFFGSIPFSWLLVRAWRGIDIRKYGSGTVSGTMVGVLVSKPAAVLVGILDILKALVPVFIGKVLAPASFLPLLIGIGAFIGHTWPVWLGFQGGRGVSVILGSLIPLFPIGTLWILFALGLGKILRAGAIMVLVCLAFLPFLSFVFHKPTGVTIFCAILFLLTVIKRLEANQEPLPQKGKIVVLLRRLLLDRDILDYQKWISRRL